MTKINCETTDVVISIVSVHLQVYVKYMFVNMTYFLLMCKFDRKLSLKRAFIGYDFLTFEFPALNSNVYFTVIRMNEFLLV